MDDASEVWLVRHGETAWSRDHRHTSTTDLPLTEVGVEVAHGLAGRLGGVGFDLVLTSPRQRARRTAELAGFGDRAVVDEDLVEWDYGDYEGITTLEIRRDRARLDGVDAPLARAARPPSRSPNGSTGLSNASARRRAGCCCSGTATRCARSPPAGSASR